MIDLNTHILSNPYDYNDDNISITSKDDFLNKINNLLTSLVYSSSDVPDFSFMSDDLKIKAISLSIPEELNELNFSKIYLYSKPERFQKIIDEISKLKLDDSLKENSDLNEILNSVNEKIEFLNSYTTDKKIEKFSDILKNFDDVNSIIDNSIYINIINWIRSYPLNMIESIIDTYANDKENNSEIYTDLLSSIYKLYKVLIYDITQTKLFWTDFIKLIDIENESTDINVVSSDDSFIFDDILDLDDEDDIAFDEPEDDENKLGTEDAVGPGNAIKRVANGVSKIGGILKSIPTKVSRINKQFKLFRLKNKNHSFYMKYIGRVDGLYERYADEAKLKENKMIDDPVKILKDDAKDYIVDVSDKFTDLQIELLDMAKRFSTMTNPKEMLSYINRYCGMYKSEMKKPNQIPTAMMKATKFKIANILLEHNKIYGYNAESIVENGKIPPANHAIVSLFVDRPDEEPFEQSVSDIFKEAASFKLIAKNEKEPIFEVTQVCNNLISKGIQSNDVKSIKRYKKESYRNVKSNLNDFVENEDKPRKAKVMYTSQVKNTWKGIQKSADYMIHTKSYISDLINGYFIMMMRIDNLCKECVTSLLNVERFKKDSRYKTGFNADKKNDNNKYKQAKNEKEYKNKATKEQEREEQRSKAYADKKAAMRQRIDDLKAAMRAR